MDILRQTDLRKLIETTDRYCVSLYLPTHRTGREQQQDPIRLKNLAGMAVEKLLDFEVSNQEVGQIMRPAELLMDQRNFWQHQSDGLALFLSKEFAQTFRLPFTFDELVVIGNNFHIKPLLPLLSKNEKFYILAISMKKVRLFLGTKSAVEEIDLGDMPTNIDDALLINGPEKHLGFHTSASSPGRSGMRRALFHGQGSKPDAEKTNLLRYFQIIDKGLGDVLEETHIPMILAGVDYLLPIYHEANTFSGLLNEGLEGNPDEIKENELHTLAWEMIKPLFKHDQEQAINRFNRLYGQKSKLASIGLKSVLRAAHRGQIETLLVSIDSHCWGRYDEAEDALEQHDEFQIFDRDLLDLAAAKTLAHDGNVYVLAPQDIPERSQLAAIYRYETGHK